MSRSFRLVFLAVLSSVLLMPMTTTAQKSAPVRHVVVFKYKKDATPDKIAQVTRAFRALRGSIPGITAFEDGVNNSLREEPIPRLPAHVRERCGRDRPCASEHKKSASARQLRRARGAFVGTTWLAAMPAIAGSPPRCRGQAASVGTLAVGVPGYTRAIVFSDCAVRTDSDSQSIASGRWPGTFAGAGHGGARPGLHFSSRSRGPGLMLLPAAAGGTPIRRVR